MSANSSTLARDEGEPREPARPPPSRCFTLEELAQYDGSVAGRPILIAYGGRVYEVGRRFLWLGGRHFSHQAGRDLTNELAEAPHGEEMLACLPLVGLLAETAK